MATEGSLEIVEELPNVFYLYNSNTKMLGDYCMKKRRGFSALLTMCATVGSMSRTSPAMAEAYVITIGGTTPTFTKAEAYGQTHKLWAEPGFIAYDWSASENNIISFS